MNKELCGDYCINLSQLETRSGVYFLYQNEKLVYIGKANNITRRILEHIEEGVKVFNSVRYSIVPIDSLSTVETSLIKNLKPYYNISVAKSINYENERETFRSSISIVPVILINGKRKDGSYPVYIRITYKRNKTHFRTNLKAYEEDINGCRIINEQIINDSKKIMKPLENAAKFISPNMSFEFVKKKLSNIFDGNIQG